MNKINSKTIVFITGAFVSNHCWDAWKIYFENKGYTTHNLPWPYKDGTADVLRSRHPDKAIASNTLQSVTKFYENFVRALPEAPILIGHSFGGLMVQLLLNRGLGAAGIAIHSAPPQFLLSAKFSFAKSAFPAFGFFTDVNKSYLMSLKQWQYAFTNKMSPAEQKSSYEVSVIPESKRLFRTALTQAAKIDYTKPHAPLLFTAGSIDHIVPYSMNNDNYKKYNDKNSTTAYKLFEGRNHYVLGQNGWEEIAEYIYTWMQ